MIRRFETKRDRLALDLIAKARLLRREVAALGLEPSATALEPDLSVLLPGWTPEEIEIALANSRARAERADDGLAEMDADRAAMLADYDRRYLLGLAAEAEDEGLPKRAARLRAIADRAYPEVPSKAP